MSIDGKVKNTVLMLFFKFQASVSDQENIFFSISTPVPSQEEPNPNGLDHCILQDIRTNYSNFADIIEPPEEGYTLTLKLNFSRLTRIKGKIMWFFVCFKSIKNLVAKFEYMKIKFLFIFNTRVTKVSWSTISQS